MWDKPHLLRISAAMLFGVSLVLVLYSLAHYALQLPVFKLRTVQFTHAPQQVDMNQLNQVVKRSVSGSFFTIDLEQTRRSFEQLPWVRKVGVRRHFPWGLEVTLEEHVPMARWNNVALVNTYGEVFAGQSKLALPEFNGEPETSMQLAGMYVELSKQLEILHRSITQISLSPRYAWQVQLDNGMRLELGREQMQQRLARFVAVYPYSLATMQRKVNYVDLRYRNGFAVSQVNVTDSRKNESGRNSGSKV
ncbi:MAG: cell division protein FtsQ [Gallionellales bacterium 35-53-114]|jgi:cell division protein FtsQ|nr:MAG: cell division protein FtsQ [Gallionellales bacterium 35-53-114]OYZ63911.1 MAG: cell division protein FtsQ [Gallionellales bacterium 24-53-125]OZB09259.1 MAG: cell division protein FtsQ [Gallionellales bacterium 39-52-133]HQS59134.1 cell division protein FtsQ/DivIB [Gallionellaceae bacterium]HQS75870.1 cell division protein FtsQ/DivIB [Gallionellaceae bacterium]